MAIRIVQLGTPRSQGESFRLGTVRRPPRGVPKSEYARRNFYDTWLPELAPSAGLVSRALSQPWTETRWKKFAKDYRREMQEPSRQHLLGLLALLSKQSDFSVGCYCEDENRCHRSVLKQILLEHGAKVKPV